MRMDSQSPSRDLSHDPMRVSSFFYKQKGTTPQRQARLTGGTGLYMNYSIIFTEISFYPETSILLQIIQIIHMTFQIIPEFDR